jgi:hypothetical protein
MAAFILSCGAPKGISPAPRLRPALPFQEITPAFVSFETLLGISKVPANLDNFPKIENFDAAGKWRTTDSHRTKDKSGRNWRKGKTSKIDPSGAFHKDPKFASYHEMRDLIAAREKDFARGFTEHLVEYAPFQECFKDRESPFRVFHGGGLSGGPWYVFSFRKFHHLERDPGRVS